jgi:hypothetical protein
VKAFHQPGHILGSKQFCFLKWVLLLFSTLTFAAEPVLECRGGKANSPDIRFELTLTDLSDNSVVVIDTATKEMCSCKFRYDTFFDQSKGMVPGYIVVMDYQSCDDHCPQHLKGQMAAHIDVRHKLTRAESYATPFVGGVISNCDKFSIDVPTLRKFEALSIDNMDMPPEFKQKLKYLKGIEDGN